MEAHSKARLVEAPSMQGGVAATVSRSEIEETLSSAEGPAVLVLDIARRSGESETADVEAHTLEVEQEKPDLEQILRTASGDAIELRFDQGELEQALEDDVDAHGLREKALILTVAAATAAGAAGQASGMPVVDRGSGPASSISAPASTSSAPISDVVSGGPAGQAAAATPLVSDVVSGGPAGQTAESSPLVSDVVSGGPEWPRAAAATGDESTPLVSDVVSGGPAGQTAESSPLVSDVVSGGPAGAEQSALASEAVSGGPE